MEATERDGTWIGSTPVGVVTARRRRGGPLLVDRPAAGRFRDLEPLILRDGLPVVDGAVLRPVRDIPPEFGARCGWYDGDDRTVLLTQFPEAYFGEPMILVAEGDRVIRAYPVDETSLIGEDGAVVDLVDGGLRISAGGAVASLPRSPRYREEEAAFHAGGTPLSGTVIVPEGPGLRPAAVVVNGAAGGQRDLARLLAQPLLDAGLAVLIYDKAGHGRSGGAGEPSTFDQANTAAAGMDLLGERSDVDEARVGLMGFSNGMWAVPMVAARRRVAFVAGIGSPGVSMAESEVHRRTKVLREAGVGSATVTAVAEAWRCLFAIAGAGTATEEQTGRLDRVLRALATAEDLSRYEVPDFVRENPMLSPIPPSVPVEDLLAMVSGDPDPQLTYDPAADYGRMRCPVFLQYGSDDTSVPVAASVAQIEKALGDSGARATIRVYTGLEHMLNLVPDDYTGLAPEAVMYQFHRFRFGDGVRHDLTSWLREVLRC